jgi:UDP-glucose 4-epimerase
MAPSSVVKTTEAHVEWVRGDFADINLVRRALHDVEVVFHLISTSLPASSNNNLPLDLSSNVLPTLNMLEAARSAGVRKVIYTSSGGTVYGVPERTPIPEDHPLNPICAYGVHKLAIEKYLYLVHHLWGIEYAVLRPSNPYGPGQPVNRPQGAIAQFARKIAHREPVEIWGDGSVVRDYVYIDDVIRACLMLADHQGPSRTFNIGTGQGTSLLELVYSIEGVTGEKAKIQFREGRSADVPVNILDISRAGTEMNWRPEVPLSVGIRRALEGF